MAINPTPLECYVRDVATEVLQLVSDMGGPQHKDARLRLVRQVANFGSRDRSGEPRLRHPPPTPLPTLRA